MVTMGMLFSFITIATQIEINAGFIHIGIIFERCYIKVPLGTYN